MNDFVAAAVQQALYSAALTKQTKFYFFAFFRKKVWTLISLWSTLQWKKRRRLANRRWVCCRDWFWHWSVLFFWNLFTEITLSFDLNQKMYRNMSFTRVFQFHCVEGECQQKLNRVLFHVIWCKLGLKNNGMLHETTWWWNGSACA